MWQPSTHHGDVGNRSERAHQRGSVEEVVSIKSSECQPSARGNVEMPAYDWITVGTNRHIRGPLELKDSRLGRLVRIHRGMPVEMIRSEVQPNRGVGTELLRPRQAKARALDYEGVVAVVIDGVEERDLRVAERFGLHPSRPKDRNGQQGRRGLAVSSGNRQNRPRSARALLLPTVSDLDLTLHRNTSGVSGHDDGVTLWDARCR